MDNIDTISDITEWSEKDFIRECSIKSVALYYSYYGKLIEFKTVDLFNSPMFKRAYAEFLYLIEVD